MKLQLLSDLHLETHPRFQPSIAPVTEVLVLAGDIGSYQPESALLPGGAAACEDFGLSRFSPRKNPALQNKRVLFTPGNHEYDGFDLEPTRERLRAICHELGIDFLDRATLAIGDVRFIGCTLWSDFDALADTDWAPKKKPASWRNNPLARQLDVQRKAFKAANHYLEWMDSTWRGERLTAETMRELSLIEQAWLSAALAQPTEARVTVAITHFAPSLKSHDPRYGIQPATAGFCNALDGLFAHAHFWLHGHLHCAHDYTVAAPGPLGADHRCRVIANPLGYTLKGESDAFEACRVLVV
jgi:hypothetical protein